MPHELRDLTATERERFRQIGRTARAAKAAGVTPTGPLRKPGLDPAKLMAVRPSNGMNALSLFSGGGGLDIGFERAGFSHVASYELLEVAAATLKANRPKWAVYGGSDGDVTQVNFEQYAGQVDLMHGGPPCQPFSAAGRQLGAGDSRDMLPRFAQAVVAVRPRAFVVENVPALLQVKFGAYLEEMFLGALRRVGYRIRTFQVRADWFGVPQRRRRVVFVGMRDAVAFERFQEPQPTHDSSQLASGDTSTEGARLRCMGAREALGLTGAAEHPDGLVPTLRSGLTGPRKTTSVLSSSGAQRDWRALDLWPSGVAPTPLDAASFPTPDGTQRLSVRDCAVLQGFPASWRFQGPVYAQIGQIGNAVAPPVAYRVATAVATALSR